MDIERMLAHCGAAESQIQQFTHYKDCGNRKGQERILYRCMSIQKERLQEKRKQLSCLDYMISKIETEDIWRFTWEKKTSYSRADK